MIPVNYHTSNCSLLAPGTTLPRVIYGFKSENGLESRKVLNMQEGIYALSLHLLSRLHYENVRYLIIGRSYETQAKLPQSLMEFMELAVQKLDPGVLKTDSKSQASGKRLELVYTA